MKNEKMRLKIITPEKEFFNEEVDQIITRTTSGDIGILRGHSPLVTVLDIGIIRILQGETEKKATINMGFMNVNANEVSIFTDSTEWPEDIDVERATRAKERAAERLKLKEEALDVDRAQIALKRAINRIKILD